MKLFNIAKMNENIKVESVKETYVKLSKTLKDNGKNIYCPSQSQLFTLKS